MTAKKSSGTNKKQAQKKDDDLHEQWVDFASKMGDKIREMTKEETDRYSEIFETWTEYSTKVGESLKDMKEPMDKEESEEVYGLWKEYSDKMADQFSELTEGAIEEQTELYNLWMDAFSLNHEGDEPPFNIAEIMKFWTEPLMPGFKADLEYANASEQMKKVHDIWVKSASENINKFMRTPQFSYMIGDMTNFKMDLNKQIQQQVTRSLESAGFPSKEGVDEIYKKLNELERKIDWLSNNLKK